ncbi:MAG TPA: hypothetical protein VEB00_00915 [Clostridia bacterium]|nr:hypothetical protein [Clostridia bacterium]
MKHEYKLGGGKEYFDSLTSAGKLDVCGMCLYACPHGRKKTDYIGKCR